MYRKLFLRSRESADQRHRHSTRFQAHVQIQSTVLISTCQSTGVSHTGISSTTKVCFSQYTSLFRARNDHRSHLKAGEQHRTATKRRNDYRYMTLVHCFNHEGQILESRLATHNRASHIIVIRTCHRLCCRQFIITVARARSKTQSNAYASQHCGENGLKFFHFCSVLLLLFIYICQTVFISSKIHDAKIEGRNRYHNT